MPDLALDVTASGLVQVPDLDSLDYVVDFSDLGTFDDKYVKNLDAEYAKVSEQLGLEEKDILQHFSTLVGDFQGFDREIAQCEDALSKIEGVMTKFQTSLTSISNEIQQLQGDSMNMNTKVKNRRGAFTLLKDYVNSMIVSQDLAKNICDMEVNESYV